MQSSTRPLDTYTMFQVKLASGCTVVSVFMEDGPWFLAEEICRRLDLFLTCRDGQRQVDSPAVMDYLAIQDTRVLRQSENTTELVLLLSEEALLNLIQLSTASSADELLDLFLSPDECPEPYKTVH